MSRPASVFYGCRVIRTAWSDRPADPHLLNRHGTSAVVSVTTVLQILPIIEFAVDDAEGRRDRLIHLLSQAILQAREFVRRFPESGSPLAVVTSKRIHESVSKQILQFAGRYVPEVAVGVMDDEGLRSFAGPGLEELNARPRRRTLQSLPPTHVPDLFSDLNQWMLKILLGRKLGESLISVPREPIRNASHLAAVAKVSVMTASRFVNQLKAEGFLDEHKEILDIVRTDELLQRWVAASRRMTREIPTRWIITKGIDQFLHSVAHFAAESGSELYSAARSGNNQFVNGPPRTCIGVFAAADALGVGFVRGVSPHLYLERLDPDVFQQLGLSVEDADRRADVFVRIPSNRESIFRAAVHRNHLPISDILQVWVDASVHPVRGRQQADEIRRRVLRPVFGKNA